MYAARIVARLDAEERRASLLQTRGVAVITTSGAIVSLLFVLGQSALRGQTELPWPVRLLLALSAIVFVVAVAFGLAVNWPRTRWQPDSRDLAGGVSKESWNLETGMHAAQALALSDAQHLQQAEAMNNRLALGLRLAVAAETTAIVLTVAAVVAALLHG